MASIDPPPASRPRPAGLARWRPLLVQVGLIVGAALCYFGVRNLTQGDRLPAEANGRRVFDLEQALHLDWEDWLQGLTIGHDRLVDLANWVYIYGHWPLIGITLVWLFHYAHPEYLLLRNAMFISGAIGLVIFAAFPVAPPRLGVLEVVDTVTERSDSYRTLQPPGLINRYAAVPSLHFGWNLLVGVIVWRVTSRRLVRALAVLMPAAMAWAVVATGNHYVFDVVAGGVVALVGLAAAFRLPARAAAPARARR